MRHVYNSLWKTMFWEPRRPKKFLNTYFESWSLLRVANYFSKNDTYCFCNCLCNSTKISKRSVKFISFFPYNMNFILINLNTWLWPCIKLLYFHFYQWSWIRDWAFAQSILCCSCLAWFVVSLCTHFYHIHTVFHIYSSWNLLVTLVL